jgi:predicted membrane protein
MTYLNTVGTEKAMQLKTTINTSQTTHWISDLSKMNEELDKFEDRITENGTGKLIIDFKEVDLEFQGKQFDIGVIKYKKPKKKLSQETINLKDKNKSSQNLF